MLRILHILTWLAWLIPGIGAAESYAINTGFKAPVSDYYRQVIEEAFRRIGAEVDFREVPGERSIRLVNDGIDDGECCRISDINQVYPNLQRVSVPVIVVDFVAFFKGEAPTIKNWDSLKDYEVGVVSGWKILEQGLHDHPPRHLSVLSTPQSLFGMLERRRIQVATIDRLVGLQQIKDLGLQDIHAAEPPLATRQLYLYMAKRHRPVLPRLEAALRDMAREGFLVKAYRDMIRLDESTGGARQDSP